MKDSRGGDLFEERIIGTIHFIAEVCRKNTNCVGFNSNGWMKKEVKDEQLWDTWTNDAKLGFYIKKRCINRDLYNSCDERKNRNECSTNAK